MSETKQIKGPAKMCLRPKLVKTTDLQAHNVSLCSTYCELVVRLFSLLQHVSCHSWNFLSLLYLFKKLLRKIMEILAFGGNGFGKWIII